MIRALVAAAVLGAASGIANAATVDGVFAYGGGSPVVNTTTNSVSIGNGFIFEASGDFGSYINPLTDTVGPVSFNYDPLTPNPLIVWSVGGFTFTMTDVTTVFESGNFVTLIGSGQVTGNGFDATDAEWSFSNNRFSWSADTTAVPVPGTIGLLGLGLAGLGLVRRRKDA